MPGASDISWFKAQFGEVIARAVRGTPFDVDMLTALACQETGELWSQLRRKPGMTPERVAALCCGDTLDADRGRRAFPRFKEDLVAAPDGAAMFAIARKALLDMAELVPAYAFARDRPKKFAHGFGIFQYDLQFFLVNPDYFLKRRYEDFSQSLGRALGELKSGLRKLGLQHRAAISDMEFCHVAICYNTGGFDPARGLRQGHQVDGVFYGERIRDLMATVRAVPAPGTAASAPDPLALPDAAPMAAAGTILRVEIETGALLLRNEPRKSVPSHRNVIASLPDGQMVRAVEAVATGDYAEVETVLGGRVFRGFAARGFLVPVPEPDATDRRALSPAAPRGPGVPVAALNLAPGQSVTRRHPAGALSIHEPAMPRRQGRTPSERRESLNRIIDWLNPEDTRHHRYQPRDGMTFCNIYAHDYCHLAGAYLCRVWWTQPALMRIAAGERLAPRLGTTVDEMRANDLFRWLRDFGTGFGWRRATSLTEMQDHANLGGVALIAALRREDGRSGHIVPVIPETAEDSARRDATGAVTMPLQSQAGRVNFNRGRSTPAWWALAEFADWAFWIHG